MIAGAIVMKDGTIYENNVWFRYLTEQKIEMACSSGCEPTSPRDIYKVLQVSNINFIRPFTFGDPDLYSSFQRKVKIALDDTKRMAGIYRYRCRGLEGT